MTAAAERQALYRELVLSAAEREFGRVGFADTKMAAVAHAADLSLTTVYKTFAGKGEIWNELHAQRMQGLLGLVESRTTAADSPLERLLAGIAGVAEYLTDHDAYLELNLRSASGWLAAAEATGVQRTIWAAGVDMIASGVDGSRAAGELTDIRTRVATGLIISALQVWLADWVDSGRDRDPDVVIAELVSHLRVLLTAPAHPPAAR